jgi:hypothetical protein
MSIVHYHPWYSMYYALTGDEFLPLSVNYHLVQGDKGKQYYIYDMRKRRIPDGDTYDKLGFHWFVLFY